MTTDRPEARPVPGAEALLAARPTGLDDRPAPTVAAARSKPSPTAILIGVVAAGAIFAGGVLLGNHMGEGSSQSATPRFPGGFPSARANGGAGGFGGGGFTSGEITAVKGDTLTVTTADGTSVTVKTSSDTTVMRSETSDVASLAVGEQVTVIGQTADGAVTARSITEGSGGIGFGGIPGGGADQLPGQAAAAS